VERAANDLDGKYVAALHASALCHEYLEMYTLDAKRGERHVIAQPEADELSAL